MKILLVDDDVRCLSSLTRLLEEEGHNVTARTDGMQAIIWLGQYSCDLVITDHQMPKASGLDVARVAQSCSPAPTVWMMSAALEPEIQITAKKFGVKEFFFKPFDRDKMIEKIIALAPTIK